MSNGTKVRIAHIAGPRATIQNSPPLVTSNKARLKYGLKPLTDVSGRPPAFDALRAQRLALPATIYIEQFSAHPLEADASDLYGPPDGYVSGDGIFRTEQTSDTDKPVYVVELRPEDGLYPLPYMARQSDGSPWEEECAVSGAGDASARQTFFPDGSRSFEEIDRLSIDSNGWASTISSVANIDFYRSAPPSGYRRGLPSEERTDEGDGDIPPEVRGVNYFPYRPHHLASAPPRPMLAKITNDVQAIAESGKYEGIIWTEGSPQIEECAYWFNLLIDSAKPICGNAAQRPHGQISNDGPKNIVDSVNFIASRVWADENDRNRCGVVLIQEQQLFAAREVAKVDARPGGFVATGGHGGIIGQITHTGRMLLTYLPAYKHTHRSDLRITELPRSVSAVKKCKSGVQRIEVVVKDGANRLLPDAIPVVSIVKDGSFSTLEFGEDPELELDLIASIDHKLRLGKLAGFVIEGLTPYGTAPSPARNMLLLRATFCGLPVAKVGRNAPEGFADPHEFQIAASNLTSTKARLLLMACLMKFGSLPAAADPDNPRPEELAAIRHAVAQYQQVFDTH